MIAAAVIVLIIFTLLSGLFSASETALFSLSQMRLRSYARDPRLGKRLIARLLATPRDLLVTILTLNILVNLLVQNTAATLFSGFSNWGLSVGVPLALTLFFGEIIPKSVALPNNERVASLVAPVIGVLHRLLRPIRRFLAYIAFYVSRLLFFFLKREKEISMEEMRHALRASERHGVLSAEEAELIQGYLDFREAKVKELLRPRGELLFFDTKDPLSHLTYLFSDQECSRVPICAGGLENIEGVIEASDFFIHRAEVRSVADLRRLLRRPFFVPESMMAPMLWHKFRERDEELAVVVDEYGSISGVITREDLAEVVVGEISDRRDAKGQYTRAGAGVIIASGKLELDEFNEIFNSELTSASNLVTLGGWITEQLGHLPKAGTKFISHDFLFHVLAADVNRIRRVYVRRLEPSERSQL